MSFRTLMFFPSDTNKVLLCSELPDRYLAKLSSVGSIRDEETCERLRGLIQRQVPTSAWSETETVSEASPLQINLIAAVASKKTKR